MNADLDALAQDDKNALLNMIETMQTRDRRAVFMFTTSSSTLIF